MKTNDKKNVCDCNREEPNLSFLVPEYHLCMELKDRKMYPQEKSSLVYFKDNVRNGVFVYRREGAEVLYDNREGSIVCAAPLTEELVAHISKILSGIGFYFSIKHIEGKKTALFKVDLVSDGFNLLMFSEGVLASAIAKILLQIKQNKY